MNWKLVSPMFFLLGLSMTYAQKCNEAELKNCMDELQALTNNQDLAFAHTEEDLKQVCKHLKDALSCVNGFTARCFGKSQQELYHTLTSGAQELLSDLCTEGSEFRKKYLKHAGCYKNLADDYKQCSEHYLKEQNMIKSQHLDEEGQLRMSCCLFDGYKQCTKRAVLANCSSEAAEFGEQIVVKAGGPLVQNHCAKYRYDSPHCSSAVKLVSSIFLLLLMVLSVLKATWL